MFPENDWRYYLMHSDDKDMKYGLPGKKKYPMPDREHVRSAIKFFNYVSPSDEKELARNIIARIKEYRIVGINVGKENRFRKYYNPRPLIHSGIQGMKLGVTNDYRNYLEHHGVLGMHWGIRRFQNPDGTLTAAGKRRRSETGGRLYDALSGNSKAKKRLAEFSSLAKQYGYSAGEPTKDYSTVLFNKTDRSEKGHPPTRYMVKVALKDRINAKLPPHTSEDVKNMLELSEDYREHASEYNSLIRNELAKRGSDNITRSGIKKLNCIDVFIDDSGVASVTMDDSDYSNPNGPIVFDVDFDIKKKKVVRALESTW